ncbi:MAG: hypothetical protein WBS19_06490 [Candidatus Korobacteraceae bacterium]
MPSVDSKKETKSQRLETDDPVLLMLGVGKQLWERESGDKFIERLRAEDLPHAAFEAHPQAPAENAPEAVWHRIKTHQGEEFRTATRLPFTYEVEGAGIWFFRDGRRIERKLSRVQVDKGIARCPLTSTTEIKDLMDYAYLFGLLTDARIRGDAW